MTYDEKLDAILDRLSSIESVLLTVPPDLTKPDDLGFVKPAVRDVSPWLDKRMTSPDPVEAKQRALHGVSWAGTVLSDERYDKAWEEVEYLLAAQPFDPRCAPYMFTVPEVTFFCLLTGAVALPDEKNFGRYDGSRDPQKLVGVGSIAAYLAGLPVFKDGGGPSGR